PALLLFLIPAPFVELQYSCNQCRLCEHSHVTGNIAEDRVKNMQKPSGAVTPVSSTRNKSVVSRFLLVLLLLLLALGALAAGSLAMVRRTAAGRLYSSAAEIPHRHVGLVLGCSRRLGDGTPNPFFNSRIHAAIELFHSGKVDYFLVSGDNH